MKSFSIAIAGGGSTYTPDMLEMLCLVRSHFPLRRVVLYDIDEERQGHVGRFGRSCSGSTIRRQSFPTPPIRKPPLRTWTSFWYRSAPAA